MKKSRKTVSRRAAWSTWIYVLWCDVTTLRRYDFSWRAIALHLLVLGFVCLLCGVIFLVQGIVSLHPSVWIFGAIILGSGFFALVAGLLFRSSRE